METYDYETYHGRSVGMETYYYDGCNFTHDAIKLSSDR
jgi:hypothetical protein